MREDHPNDSIIKNGQNIEKSPGDLRRLAVSQTLVKKPSANADVKNSKEVVIVIIIMHFIIQTNGIDITKKLN